MMMMMLLVIAKGDEVDAGIMFLMIWMTTMNLMIKSRGS